MKSGITMLIHNKDDIQFVTPFFLVYLNKKQLKNLADFSYFLVDLQENFKKIKFFFAIFNLLRSLTFFLGHLVQPFRRFFEYYKQADKQDIQNVHLDLDTNYIVLQLVCVMLNRFLVLPQTLTSLLSGHR